MDGLESAGKFDENSPSLSLGSPVGYSPPVEYFYKDFIFSWEMFGLLLYTVLQPAECASPEPSLLQL